MVYFVIMQTLFSFFFIKKTKDITLGMLVSLSVKQTEAREVTNYSINLFFHQSLVFIRSTLLGKVLRLDVENNDDGAPYSIPLDNPFVWEKNSRPGKSCTGRNVSQD